MRRRTPLLNTVGVLVALLGLAVGGYALYWRVLGDDAVVVVQRAPDVSDDPGSGRTAERDGAGQSSVDGGMRNRWRGCPRNLAERKLGLTPVI